MISPRSNAKPDAAKRAAERTFQAAIEGAGKGRVYLVLPFDPAKAWGPKPRYHVRGAINGMNVRGALERFTGDTFCRLVQRTGAEAAWTWGTSSQ